MIEDFYKDVVAAYKQQKEIEKEQYKKGYCFNIFNILGLSSNETRTHSAFLAELLNPQGSHGNGDSFLREFISCMHLEDLQFDIKNAYVYLTLNKEAASDASTLSDDAQLMPNIDYYPITYQSDIIPWLSKCNLDLPSMGAVSIIVNQYINLLKQLTNTMEKNNILLNVLKKEENWAYTLEILKNADTWKNEVWNTFVQLLKDKIETKGWILENNGLGNVKVYSKKEAEYFICLTKGAGGAFIGISSEAEKSPQECLPCLYGAEPWWPFGWKWLERDYKYFLPQSDSNSFEYLLIC